MEFSELSGPKKQVWHELLLWVDGPLATACDSQPSLQQAQGDEDANQGSATAVCAVCSPVLRWGGRGASRLAHFWKAQVANQFHVNSPTCTRLSLYITTPQNFLDDYI